MAILTVSKSSKWPPISLTSNKSLSSPDDLLHPKICPQSEPETMKSLPHLETMVECFTTYLLQSIQPLSPFSPSRLFDHSPEKMGHMKVNGHLTTFKKRTWHSGVRSVWHSAPVEARLCAFHLWFVQRPKRFPHLRFRPLLIFQGLRSQIRSVQILRFRWN